jgi:hypothetical protein
VALVGASGARYLRPAFPSSGAAAAARRLPPEWRAHVAAAREGIVWGLQTLNPNALELSRVWFESGYAAARLVDVTGPEFLARLPLQVGRPQRFLGPAAAQARHRRRSWLHTCSAQLETMRTLRLPIGRPSASWHAPRLTAQSPIARASSPPAAQAEPFRAHQAAAAEQLRAQLWTHWLPKCADVFARCPAVPINDDAAAYFR